MHQCFFCFIVAFCEAFAVEYRSRQCCLSFSVFSSFYWKLVLTSLHVESPSWCLYIRYMRCLLSVVPLCSLMAIASNSFLCCFDSHCIETVIKTFNYRIFLHFTSYDCWDSESTSSQHEHVVKVICITATQSCSPGGGVAPMRTVV